MNGLPDFIIIGAMKCATSTLHDQLATQSGVFMSEPKEPCFFSDDANWNRGIDWYRGLFADAQPGDTCGESSTHYTKLPTHPHTVRRMRDAIGTDVRLIYMMRHPIDRLVSQYIHEWSQGSIPNGMTIDDAVDEHVELVDYGRYAYQLQPYLEAFGTQSILPVFFERFVAQPHNELQRVGAFLNLPAQPKWIDDLGQRNVSNERMRRSGFRDALLAVPGVRPMLRRVVPQQTRHRIMRQWSMQQRPELLSATRDMLEALYDDDLTTLGSWLGMTLNCATFTSVARSQQPTWRQPIASAAS